MEFVDNKIEPVIYVPSLTSPQLHLPVSTHFKKCFRAQSDSWLGTRAAKDPSVLTITEKVPTLAFTFKTLLRHYAKSASTINPQ